MRRAALLVASLLLVAGCLGGTDPSGSDDAPASNESVPSTGPTVDEPTSKQPGLAEPPDWQPGQWWRYRITERFTRDQRSWTVRRVVGDFENGTGSYLLGMPTANWSDPALVLHLPGFGRVDQDTLGYEIHDCPFKPLDFPLTDGKTWTTEFECRPVNATVHVKSETVAEVEMVGGQDKLTLTYDAEQEQITKIDIEGYGLIEVLGGGEGFDGRVTSPHNHDLVFRHGRIAGALGFDLRPAPPRETVEVDDTYHRVSFVFILGTILPDTNGPPGLYREQAQAPDGTTYEATVTPDQRGLRFFFHQHPDPGGTWQLTHVAGGPGLAMIEGIGYHTFNRTLGQP